MRLDESGEPPAAMPIMLAADLQDDLLTAGNDLDRLQSLLLHACEALMGSFHGAFEQARLIHATAHLEPEVMGRMKSHLECAITALQFQDMACQLIAHTHHRLRSCADRVAREAMGDDGDAVVEAPPDRPNPVTQDEMDAGSVDLF